METASKQFNNRRSRSVVKKPSEPLTKEAVRNMIKSSVEKVTEHKYYILGQAFTPNSTPTVTDLAAIAQGDTDLTRDGDALLIDKIDVLFNGNGADTTNIIRYIIFQWKPNTVPAVNEILQDAVTYGVTTPLTHDTRQQYHVLHDQIIATSLNGPNAFCGLFTIPLRRLLKNQCLFVGASTTGTNKPYLILLSDSGAVTHPTFFHVSKIWFRDA